MNDLDLYNACIKYCRAFTNVVAHESQLRNAKLFFDEIEHLQAQVEYDRKWLRDEYHNLCDAIDEFRVK